MALSSVRGFYRSWDTRLSGPSRCGIQSPLGPAGSRLRRLHKWPGLVAPGAGWLLHEEWGLLVSLLVSFRRGHCPIWSCRSYRLAPENPPPLSESAGDSNNPRTRPPHATSLSRRFVSGFRVAFPRLTGSRGRSVRINILAEIMPALYAERPDFVVIVSVERVILAPSGWVIALGAHLPSARIVRRIPPFVGVLGHRVAVSAGPSIHNANKLLGLTADRP